MTGGAKKSGGIQRFKRGLHGAQQETAALLAYVQDSALGSWHSRLNGWIGSEIASPSAEDEQWDADEQLADFVHDPLRRTKALSRHRRIMSSIQRFIWFISGLRCKRPQAGRRFRI